MKLLEGEGSVGGAISASRLEELVSAVASAVRRDGGSVLLIPPDFTRFHSMAGDIAAMLFRRLSPTMRVDILPALGTHSRMSDTELERMFPGVPKDRFFEHDWRGGIVRVGEVPGSEVKRISGGRLDYAISVELDRLFVQGGHDSVVSIGQVVPHEVAGMANHNKNIFVGIGGKDIIDKTHFLGAVCNMEKIMGRADTPVRQVFDYAESHFLAERRILYVQTVVNRDSSGKMALRGLFAGYGREPLAAAAKLSQQTNLTLLDAPINKAVVFLDPEEFKSLWLGNKAIYRTRMAMADGGELVVLAPGLREFGEDREIDRLIRKYGYRGTETVLRLCRENEELRRSYSAAAHLIHGSSEGRFKVSYCPGKLGKGDIEGVGFCHAELAAMVKKYNPAQLKDGYNTVAGENVFFISNPAIGLWALKKNFL